MLCCEPGPQEAPEASSHTKAQGAQHMTGVCIPQSPSRGQAPLVTEDRLQNARPGDAVRKVWRQCSMEVTPCAVLDAISAEKKGQHFCPVCDTKGHFAAHHTTAQQERQRTSGAMEGRRLWDRGSPTLVTQGARTTAGQILSLRRTTLSG